MAVYTDINETELAAFLKGYGIGALMSYKGIAEGVENSNFLLHTERGYFILTLYEKRVKAGDLPFFLGLMDHLVARGISCPMPVQIQRRGDRQTGRAAGGDCHVSRRHVDAPPDRRALPRSRRGAGAAASGGRGFPIKRTNALSVKGWRPLWDAAKPRADEVEKGLGKEVEADLVDLEKHWPRGLPSGICHADLFPDNVFFLGEKLSGIIDFYFACNDFFAYDLSVCLNAWCFEKDNAFNLTKGRALLSGYQSRRKLSAEEALPCRCWRAARRCASC